MKLKDQVESILRRYPQSRDSDIALTVALWADYFRGSIKMIENEPWVKVKDLYKLPREDHIKRYRQKFNESGLYLTDKPEIKRARKQLEKIWKEELGYG